MYSLFEESDLFNIPVECFYFDTKIDDFPIRPHWHYYMEIIYMLEGTAEMHDGNNIYNLACGEMIIFDSQTVHSIYSVDGGHLRYAVFKLDINRMTVTANYSPKLRSIFKHARSKSMDIHFTKEQTGAINAEEIFHRCILEQNAQKYGYDLVVRSEIYRLLIGVLRCWQDEGFVVENKVFDEDNVFDIYSVTEYIDVNLNSNIKVSDIAKICGMSYSHFAKKFQETYRLSCKAYIEEIRIYKVEEFLIFTDFDLTYISQECGFTDCSHMIKSFKRTKGITPKQYRIQNIDKGQRNKQ